MTQLPFETPDESSYGLSALLREVLSTRERTVASHLHRLLRAARLHLGMEVAFISEFSGNRRIFRYVDQATDVDVIQEAMGDPLDDSYCKKVVEGYLPELIHNAQTLYEARALSATEELGIGAHLSTPIRLADGSVFGTFCSFSFSANHELNERDRELMQMFAEIAGELIEKDVRRAREEEERCKRITQLLESDEIRMVWQPIVDVKSESIIGAEALARFPENEYGGPEQWFEQAKRAGLAHELEARAVARGMALFDQLGPRQYLACNASAEAILSGCVVEQLQGFPLERVLLEITEHDVVEDYRALQKILAPARAEGLRLAVDDAGAGYASMRHILHLRPDLIKLDMSLTRDLDSDVAKRSLVFCLLKFAEAVGAHLVAEGVETRNELTTLKAIGVHSAQGFYLHRPMGGERLSDLLKKYR